MAACRTCSHDRSAHEHYRPGSECSLCDCTSFRGGRFARLFHRRPGRGA